MYVPALNFLSYPPTLVTQLELKFHYVYTNCCLKKNRLRSKNLLYYRGFSRKIKMFEWSYDFESLKVTQ